VLVLRDRALVLDAGDPARGIAHQVRHEHLQQVVALSVAAVDDAPLARHEERPAVVAGGIDDATALTVAFNLVTEEGMCLGSSSGINIAGAIELAKSLGPGKTIVTILCDYGSRYQSKMFNPAFLREKGLPVPAWL
jgi:hypothetical protein